jgi:hypothetical protein
MANLGKCVRCNKTCYANEGFTIGPPKDTQVYHRSCFKCTHSLSTPFRLSMVPGQNEGCTWQLSLGQYYYYEGKGMDNIHQPIVSLTGGSLL